MESRSSSRRRYEYAAAIVAVAALCASAGAQQVPDRLTALHREADALARQERTRLGELRQLEIERDLTIEDVKKAERDLADVSQQRAEATERRAALETQVMTQAPGVAARIVELYKLGRPGYVRLLFDVESVQSAARAYRTVTALVEADRHRLAMFRRSLDDLRTAERTLAQRSAQILALETEARQARQAAERAIAQRAALIARIDAQRDLTARMIGELQVAQQKLAALSPAAADARTARSEAVASLAGLRGSLDWPARGALSARFGSQRTRFGTTTVNAGVEIAASEGTAALAVADGVVAFAEPVTGYGNLVIVDHGRQTYSLYGYLGSVEVTRGMRVVRGQALGAIGQSPAGKAGLYFELRIDGRAVDPVQWLKQR